MDEFLGIDVVLIADMDLSRLSGDVIRTVAFATELKKNGFNVTLISSNPSNEKLVLDLQGINLIYTSVTNQGGSIFNILKRTWALIKAAREFKDDYILLIETSLLGGYFSLAGFHNYILDIHGIYFSEIDYESLPFYIPSGIYRRYNKFLEKRGAKFAGKVITVSNSMSEYVINNFEVVKGKVKIIPNGYFDFIIEKISKDDIKVNKGTITFIGNLTKWANVDKIIRAAKNFEDKRNIKFNIVGDGPYRKKLEDLSVRYNLENTNFKGRIPIEDSYNMIAKSEIMLLPFSEDLYSKVACPIKVLEYMAFGKAMVIDKVDDLSKYLEKNSAALTTDPDNEEKFIESIYTLLNNKKLKKELGNNAKNLSKEFTWSIQGKKLAKVIGEVNGVS